MLLASLQRTSTFKTGGLWVGIALWLMAVGVFHIGTQSIWFDEGWSAFATSQPTFIDALNSDATNPPLYYGLIYLHSQLLGDSEFALRLFSLFCNLLCLALVFRLAKRWSGDRAGILASLFLALMPLFWWSGQEARMYSYLALICLLLLSAWHHILDGDADLKTWIFLIGSELILLYSHNTGPIFIIWVNCVSVLAWIFRQKAHPFPFGRWMLSQAVVVVLWMPYFINRFLNLTSANNAVASTLDLSPTYLYNFWRGLWQTPWERIRITDEWAWVPIIALAVFVLVIHHRNGRVRWLLVHFGVLLLGMILGLAALQNDVHIRYLVAFSPMLALIFGLSSSRFRDVRLVGTVTLVFAGMFLFNLFLNTDSPYRHDDARRMTAYYAENLTAEDSVLMWSYADRYEFAYYWDRLDVHAQRITLPEGEDLDAILPLLPTSGDVSANVWYTQRADYRGMLSCLLGNGTLNEPETFTVHGMTDNLFRSPSLQTPIFRPASWVFDAQGVDLIRVQEIADIPTVSGNQALCLPITIELLSNTSFDLKALISVRNDLNMEIARADAIFAQADQQLTSQVSAGETLTAYPLIRLPMGTPAGEYTIYLRIYDETSEPSGLVPQNRDVIVSGRDLQVGTWTVTDSDWTSVTRAPSVEQLVNWQINPELNLVGYSIRPTNFENIANGSFVDLTLLWQGRGTLPSLQLTRQDEATLLVEVLPASPAIDDDRYLEWRRIQIPVDADGGTYQIRLGTGEVLTRFHVESLPLQLERPEMEQAVQVGFPEVGDLVGYTLVAPEGGEGVQLTLLWQALEMPSTISYTVFVQLINAEGQVVGQSDLVPANNARPTTGWHLNEYILDEHWIPFNSMARRETVQLIVGLYDPIINQRLVLENHTNFSVLMDMLNIEPSS